MNFSQNVTKYVYFTKSQITKENTKSQVSIEIYSKTPETFNNIFIKIQQHYSLDI